MERIVSEIVLSDQKSLKEEKIDEFEHGVRPDGSRIGMYRDPEYKNLKLHQNPLADGYVDLLYTYKTARSLFVKNIKPKTFQFGWNDTHDLIPRYGIDIMGLNQEWFEKRQAEIYRYTLIYQINKNFKVF